MDAYLYLPRHHVKSQFSKMREKVKELSENYEYVYVFTNDARSFFWDFKDYENVVALESLDNIIQNVKLLTDSFSFNEGLDLYIYKSPTTKIGYAQTNILEHSNLLRDIPHKFFYYDVEDKEASNAFKNKLVEVITALDTKKNEKS